MRNKGDEREQYPQTMLFITTPSQTTSIYQTGNDILEPPLITAAPEDPEVPPLILGPDTCGFADGSAITCDPGEECLNVGSYRGCCVASASNCGETIYTGCFNYGQILDLAMCGPQTLCCPSSNAYCATYGFTTTDEPGATFTHIRCTESPNFEQLDPYPPEPTVATSDLSTEEPSRTPSTKPASNPVPTRTIAGSVVGGTMFVVLVILGIVLLIKRRRQRRKGHVRGKSGGGSIPGPSKRDAYHENRDPSFSMIGEQRAGSNLPIPSPRDKRRSTSSTLRRYSFAENWPLGPRRPTSPGNPLSSHPVNVEMWSSSSGSASQAKLQPKPQSQSSRRRRAGVPILKIPTPPLPEAGLSPPPPPPKRLKVHQSSIGSPTSAGSSVLRSPRLSCIPPPTVGMAIGEGPKRTSSKIDDSLYHASTSGAKNQGTASDLVSPLSPDGDLNDRISPMTVSPLESPRGSGGQATYK
ncbi:hypothetical protein GGR51DRAFT_153499 [Nemania sp. FL0031]|nr:hypothetical protein GGR51DRAFT_153499 [Nemania sp. FL0031]